MVEVKSRMQGEEKLKQQLQTTLSRYFVVKKEQNVLEASRGNGANNFKD